jgi:hypothetical protein
MSDQTPKPPADEKTKPQSLRDYVRSLGWVDETAEHQGETTTIIGAPRPPKKPA